MIPSWAYHFSRRLGRGLLGFLAPVKAAGLENIPLTGAFVIATNHVSWLDPFVVGMTCSRRLAFFSKIEVLGNPLVRAFAEGYLVIAVDRDVARVDTVKKALRFMEAGIPVMVTPEGTRSRDGQLQAFKPGFVKLAHAAKVPILPVGITGTYEMCPRGRKFPRPGKIGVHFGRPYFDFIDAGAKLDDQSIAKHIARMRAEVMDLLA